VRHLAPQHSPLPRVIRNINNLAYAHRSESIMKIQHWGAVLPLVAALASVAAPALAISGMYATEPEAVTACGTDEVVWVDLDRGRFYHKAQAEYAKSHNGAYTCMKTAHAQYRPGHD
jgi:hypothetical protein